jgi:hypothetical protein
MGPEGSLSTTKSWDRAKPKDEPGASVDEQIEDSFPASDPPSYNAGGRVGQPRRDKSKGQANRAEK